MYQNQPGPYHYRHPSQYSGPPPAKKPRGNPIITRYPPPPGYKPPPQAQPPFGQHPGWQQQPPGFAPAPTAYGVGYQQPQYVQQAPAYPPQYQTPHPASVSSWNPVPTPQSAPPQPWQPQQNGFSAHPDARRHHSLPNQLTGSLLDGNGDPMPPPDLLSNIEDLEEEFDAECYFARYPDQINPDLSLGIIEWKAPQPARRALPSTFAEAELEAIAPRPPQPSDLESISDYFINSKREEALLSVRQTEVWKDIRGEVIFKEFAAVCSKIISLSELLESYRARFDPAWAEGDRGSPTPELSRGSTPADGMTRNGTAMDMDDRRRSVTPGAHGVLDDLERALRGDARSETHSRAGSVSSQHTGRLSRPKPLPPIRDQKQEDLLAALGVTGSPKLVYQTPGPAFGPPPTTKPGDSHSRANSISSANSGFHDTTRTNGKLGTNGVNFDVEPDNDATPRPKFPRDNSSRKRSYADTAAGALHDSASEDEQATPKQRRKHQRVGSGYE